MTDTTGKAIAHTAAQILEASKSFAPDQQFYVRRKAGTAFCLRVEDVVSMAASLINQSEPKAKRK